MRRLIVLLFVLCFALTSGCLCAGFGEARSPSPSADRTITAFFLFRTGSVYSPSYSISLSDGEYMLYVDDEPQPISEEDVGELYDIYTEYGVEEWNGFNKSDERVLDGEGFNIEISFSDSTYFTARGTNSFPPGYYDVMDAWLAVLERAAGGTEESMEKKITVTVGGSVMTAVLDDNASAEAFYELLLQGDITVDMSDYGGFEKVGSLGTSIVRSDEPITTVPGDIILYQGNKITIYYDVNTWDFTLLGHIEGATGENMREFLGSGDITAVFSADQPGQ